MTSVALRRNFGGVALGAAIFAFVRMRQVGDWVAVPCRMPYSGRTFSGLPLQIEKDGFYLVQLEVSRKAIGEAINGPLVSPLESLVSNNGKEIGTATKSEWYGQDAVYFSFYGFPATKGQHVLLSIKPSRTFSSYKSHELHLVVQRDDWDYGIFMVREVGWFLLVVLFLAIAAGLLASDLQKAYRQHRRRN